MQQAPFMIVKAPEIGDLFSVNASTVPATWTQLDTDDVSTLPLVYAASRLSYKTLRIDGFSYVAVDPESGTPGSCQKYVMINITHVNSLPVVEPVYKDVTDLYAALPFVDITLLGSDADESEEELQYLVSSLPLSGVLREPSGRVIDKAGTTLTGRELQFYPDELIASAGVLASFTYQASDRVSLSRPAVVEIIAANNATKPIFPVGGAGYAMRLNGSSSLTFGLWRDWGALHVRVCMPARQ
jgi:hypothetical protein